MAYFKYDEKRHIDFSSAKNVSKINVLRISYCAGLNPCTRGAIKIFSFSNFFNQHLLEVLSFKIPSTKHAKQAKEKNVITGKT